MPLQEYAYYTLANTMLGTMTILADGGISTGVMAQGGKVWQDKNKLGVVLVTGLNLRRKFAIASIILSVPILFYLLLQNGASILTASLITLALIPAFFAALTDSLLAIVPKLHQSILPLQKNQIAVSTGRLALTSITMFLFPWAFIAILASGLTRIWGNIQLRQIAYRLADKNQNIDNHVQIEILTIVKRKMPESIYYCLSGQINIFLISLFGTSTSLASLGALGRFSMITSFTLIIFTTLFIPRFARFEEDRKRLLNITLSVIIILSLLSFFIIFTAYIFSNQFLWILGESYSELNCEFILIIIACCFSIFQGVFFSINSAKGWVISPLLYILVSVISTILSFFLFDISTLEGIIKFNMTITVIQSSLLISYCFFKISKCSIVIKS